MGAKGVISVASNVVPRMVSDMTHYAMAGEWQKAKEIHFKLLPLFTNLFIDSNPIPVKTAVRMMKRPSGIFRLPLCEMDQSNQDILRKTLADLRLV
jgi:4-hydroxy-tetrahydrodipicolinate synthase